MAHTASAPQNALLHDQTLRHARPFTRAQPQRKRCSHWQPRSASEEQPDLVTRWYGKIFGQKALDDRNPFGMKRLDAEEAPEMFPATTDRLAEAVDGDDADAALVRPLMAGTRLERAPLRCSAFGTCVSGLHALFAEVLCRGKAPWVAYSANKHGWTADAFHSRVNTLGAGGGAICGGYNPAGWIGLGDDRDSIAAFLFTWPDGDTRKDPIKLEKVGGASMAVLDKQNMGPQFGPDGLKIPLQGSGGKERTAQSRLGSYYAKLPGGGRSLFADSDNSKAAVLADLKVLVADGEPEDWELDGIVWKTK